MTSRTPPPAPVVDLDWSPQQARALGEQVLDLWEEFLARLPELPVSRNHSAEELRAAVALPIPEDPLPLNDLTAYLRDLTFSWSMYPGHPGFMAYVSGAGTVPGAAADLLAAALNQNLGGWRLSPGGTEIELHLIRWFADQFGLPGSAGGLLTSGGAMATFTALKAARDAGAGWDVREEGVAGGPDLTLYASKEGHSVIDRAADMLGLGRKAVRYIGTDADLRLRVDLLREAITADRERGLRPIAVIASAGTVATGAIDPLDDLAELCREYKLWFHVDGAYGGPASWVPELQPLFKGIEKADSIAFDPHKWLYTPHSGGALLVRDAERLRESFAVAPSYLREDKALTGRGEDLHLLGPQFSRSFQALKIWVSLLAHGRTAYLRRIAHDVELARYLHRRVVERAEFEPMAPQVLSIACFRYLPNRLADHPEREPYLNRLNERLMTELQRHGRVYPSNAVIDGRFALRACIVNFRTEAQDIDALLDVAAMLGQQLDGQLRPESLRSSLCDATYQP